MIAEVLATGDEIRTGALVDSNSAFIAELLTRSGIDVRRHLAVGDDLSLLVAVIREISERADVAVMTGGLGPTADDLTTQAMADAAGVPLELDSVALENVERFFRSFNRPMSASNRKQAMLPQGALMLDNPVGTAPGLTLRIGRCTFYCLPGVPHEMRKMMNEQVLPRLEALKGGQPTFCLLRTLSSFGLPESVVGEKVSGLEDQFPGVKVGLRAKFPEIQVKLYLNTRDQAQGERTLSEAADWAAKQLGRHLFSHMGLSMAETVGQLLRQQGATVALAESCTGGLVCNWLTDAAGSSDYFLFGAVTYANAAKTGILGVSPETLAQVGAVDEKTAAQMAEGARRVGQATYGVATTGIAGPSGGSEEKPVGTVCIAVAGPSGTITRKLYFPFGGRLMNKKIFATAALDFLRRAILGEPLS